MGEMVLMRPLRLRIVSTLLPASFHNANASSIDRSLIGRSIHSVSLPALSANTCTSKGGYGNEVQGFTITGQLSQTLRRRVARSIATTEYVI